MDAKEIEVFAEGKLVVPKDTLEEAGLRGSLRLIIQQGEIRILPQSKTAPESVLEDLAGCLGNEPVADYDFRLKIGGLYEAR